MPREFRKRGKKTKKTVDKDERKPLQDNPRPREDFTYFHDNHEEEPQAGPSWIISAPQDSEEASLEAPFGYLDADVKAYFRTVDVQIRNWQENDAEAGEENDNVDPNEERRLFFIAALTEMSNKEKQLATDPDCSNILERMTYSMDDFARRVFIDRLAGSYEVLVKHRFASHVCQTLFTIAADTVTREQKGILPPTSNSSDEGELRTVTELIVAICEELRPSFTSLIMDPFASHVIRALLLLLSPSLSSSDKSTSKSLSTVRSKKSTAWKARQAPMKNVFEMNKGKASSTPTVRSTPNQFREASANFVRILREELGENEVRALAADKVASPVLQMMLELEADQGTSDERDSLMDRVLVGIITSYNEDPRAIPEQSDYLSTLFRDSTSSHLLETLVTRAPDRAFTILWSTYFQGKLARLSAHPVANFVVARAIERVNADQLESACEELNDAWGKIIKSSRTGVLRAMVDRAAILRCHEKEIREAMYAAFDLVTVEDHNFFVPCVMTLKPLPQYQSSMALAQSRTHDPQVIETHKKGHRDTTDDPLEPKVQGAILLQSLLRLSEPHNLLVVDSIKSLPMEDLLKLAHHPTSSRVLDAILESPSVSFKVKRNFVMSFIGHYHALVDDRIGSRVGDRCWAFADPYLREKIARSLFAHEQFLAGSFYGKFFARNLNLYMLQRKPDDWKNLQSQQKLSSSQPIKSTPADPFNDIPPALALPAKKPTKRKRDTCPDNEIDTLFNKSLGQKVNKAVLKPEQASAERFTSERTTASHLVEDKGLNDVLVAIRAAPKDEHGVHGRKKRAR